MRKIVLAGAHPGAHRSRGNKAFPPGLAPTVAPVCSGGTRDAQWRMDFRSTICVCALALTLMAGSTHVWLVFWSSASRDGRSVLRPALDYKQAAGGTTSAPHAATAALSSSLNGAPSETNDASAPKPLLSPTLQPTPPTSPALLAPNSMPPAVSKPAPSPIPEPPAGPCSPDLSFEGATWYNTYARAVRAVRPFGPCSDCLMSSPSAEEIAYMCSRWWHPTPQREYSKRQSRIMRWKPAISTGNVGSSPRCEWQTANLAGEWSDWVSSCSPFLRHLFQALDALGVVYFPRSGTELTVVRGGKVSESDIDLFVDMPSTKLQAALKPLLGELGNGLHLEGSGRDQELHWKTRCMFEVHMVFNGR